MARGAGAWRVWAVLPAFGVDTFAASLAVPAGQGRRRWATVAAFVLAEAGMPVLGAALGRVVRGPLGPLGTWLGAAVLAALGTRELLAWRRERGEQDEDRDRGRPVWLAALAVGLDEFGAGVGAGSAGLPLRLLVPALAVQALVLSTAGLALGGVGRRWAEEDADLWAGALLWVAAVLLAAGG
jgi:putative Mn2+ efflux pump MntP